MRIKKIVLGSLLVFACTYCTEQIVNPIESPFQYPEKLSLYESSYDYNTARQRRIELINSIPNDAIVVITTNGLYLRNGDVDYEFRAASNFYYLTGFEEPNSIAVLRKNASAVELIMFVEKERFGTNLNWLGQVSGINGAKEKYGADSAYAYEDFQKLIRFYLNTGKYKSVYANFAVNAEVSDSFYKCGAVIPQVFFIDAVVNQLRVIKSANEINAIRKSVNVSHQAFFEAVKMIKPGKYEYEVEAVMDLISKLNGCKRLAFPAIIASGKNVNTIHYDLNNTQMQSGDLVMIDFGAEYSYYASDVTRTFPVNGKFSSEQNTVYNIVLEAYKAVIQAAKPGVSYNYLYSLSRDIILSKMLEKGIITGNKQDIINTGRYRNYIPAGLGHCVGLDVHDPSPADYILKENMIYAFEPHIYLYEGDNTVKQNYWKASARIEDTVLITANGCEVLGNKFPVEIGDIEKLMK
ncbi:MAG: Xaa-Pro aminopeptidase [Ignavibacteriales bacterium]|nr:Xaa-Pro aminopeptidase [Ignavibacteriales bacterium]